MKKLRMMDKTGDTVLEFDPKLADAAATKEARALFDRMKKDGNVFTIDGSPVKNFNDLAEDNVAVPRIVGG